MLAPLAPHVAEELWARLGHDALAGLRGVPGGRPGAAGRGHGRVPGQVNGKVRAHVVVAAGADAATVEAAAWPTPRWRRRGQAVAQGVVVVPGRLVNFVL